MRPSRSSLLRKRAAVLGLDLKGDGHGRSSPWWLSMNIGNFVYETYGHKALEFYRVGKNLDEIEHQLIHLEWILGEETVIFWALAGRPPRWRPT